MNLNQALKHSMHFGSISGLCSFAVFLFLYFLVINPLGNISFIGFWIPIVFIVLAVKSYKINIGKGELTYGEGLRTGIYTGFFSALLYALLIYLFVKTIDTSLVEKHTKYLLDQLQISKEIWNNSMYHMSLEGIKKTNASSISMNEFQFKFLGGFIVSLIVAAFHKTPKQIQN